jgi:hypothetical protein
MRPVGEDALVQPAARLALRGRCHDPLKPAVDIVEILLESGVLQRLPPPSDRGWRAAAAATGTAAERGIAALDGVFRVTQQMCAMPMSA